MSNSNKDNKDNIVVEYNIRESFSEVDFKEWLEKLYYPGFDPSDLSDEEYYELEDQYQEYLKSKTNDTKNEAKFNKTLNARTSVALRDAIDTASDTEEISDYLKVCDLLISAFKELNSLIPDLYDKADLNSDINEVLDIKDQLSDLDDIEIEYDESYKKESFDWYGDDEYDEYDDDYDYEDDEESSEFEELVQALNYKLNEFYDLCDNLGVFIPTYESFTVREIKESYNITTVEEIEEGSINNMSDEEIDKDYKLFKKIARSLGVKNYRNIVVLVDDSGEFNPDEAQVDFESESRDNGLIYFYFKDEDDCNKFISDCSYSY